MKAICVGVKWGELLEPRHPRVTKQFADAVLGRMHDEDAIPLENGVDAVAKMPELACQGVDEIEIYGMWEDACVFAAVTEALKNGMNVRIPKGFTLSNEGKEIHWKEDARKIRVAGHKPAVQEDTNFIFIRLKRVSLLRRIFAS